MLEKIMAVKTKTATANVVFAAVAVSAVVAAVAVGVSVFSGGLAGVVSIPGATWTCSESNESANNVDAATIPYSALFTTYNGGLDNVKYFDVTRKSLAKCVKGYSQAAYEDTCMIAVAAIISGKTTWQSTKVTSCTAAEMDNITKRNCHLQEGFVKNANTASPAVSNWTFTCPNGCNNGACINPLYGKVLKSATNSLNYLGYNGALAGYARYFFPRILPGECLYCDAVFDSWYLNESGIIAVSDTELMKYPIKGNVTIRPGTKLLKISTDPKIFIVESGGILRIMGTEASPDLLVKIYGSAWAERLVIIPDAFFVNYTIGLDWTDATKHPDGTVIQYAGSSEKYLISNGQKRKFVGTGFNDNRYRIENVVTDVNPDEFVYPGGLDISGKEAALVNVAGSLLPN